MNALQKVITLIRDGIFNPDATRANYFAGSSHQSVGTPAHIVMQPLTPAFGGRVQPGTPGLDEVPLATGGATGAAVAHGALGLASDVKTESSWSLVAGDVAGKVIDISSDSEVDSSESDTCSNTSGQGDSTMSSWRRKPGHFCQAIHQVERCACGPRIPRPRSFTNVVMRWMRGLAIRTHSWRS